MIKYPARRHAGIAGRGLPLPVLPYLQVILEKTLVYRDFSFLYKQEALEKTFFSSAEMLFSCKEWGYS